MNKARSVSLNPSPNSFTTNQKYANLKLDIANDYRAQLDPIKTFKTFLQKIIDKKNEEISYQNPNPVQEEEKTILQPRKRASFQKLIENDDKEKENNIQEQLERIRRKNQIVALATKKVKAKYKLEKIDKAAKFNNNKLKAFTNLSTFIDTKEYLECASPLQNDKNKTKKYLNSKNMYKLKKLRHESTVFFDGKQQELLQRLKELEPVDEKAEETKNKNNHSRSSSFTDGESPQKKENSKILTVIPKTTEINGFEIKDRTRTMGILKKKEENRKVSIRSYHKNVAGEEEKADFVRSSKQRLTADNFLLKSAKEKFLASKPDSNLRIINIKPDAVVNAVAIEENKKKITLVDEAPQIKSASSFKKMKTFEAVKAYSTSREIMDFIIKNDGLFQKSDYLQENDGIYEDKLDGFYDELNVFINDQKSKKPAKYESNINKQVDSLEKLEKIVSGIITSNYEIKEDYNEKEMEEPKTTELKYKDFQNKSNEMIKLMAKTSRKLLDLEFSKNSKRNSITSIDLKNLEPKIGISSPSDPSKTSDKPYRKLNSLLNNNNPRHSKIKSESEKFNGSHNELEIKEKQIHLKKQSLSNFIYKDPNQEIENILFSCSDLYKEYGSERATLQKMEADVESFFLTTQNKINPKLDSILEGIEKKKMNPRLSSILSLKKSKNPLSFL